MEGGVVMFRETKRLRLTERPACESDRFRHREAWDRFEQELADGDA
jgi:hypothetical protein